MFCDRGALPPVGEHLVPAKENPSLGRLELSLLFCASFYFFLSVHERLSSLSRDDFPEVAGSAYAIPQTTVIAPRAILHSVGLH
jgi:hypothetical protein